MNGCVLCGEKAANHCANCFRGPYCGAECQRRDWAGGHKDTCAGLCGKFAGLKFAWAGGRDRAAPLEERATLLQMCELVKVFSPSPPEKLFEFNKPLGKLREKPMATDCALFVQTVALVQSLAASPAAADADASASADVRNNLVGFGPLSYWVALRKLLGANSMAITIDKGLNKKTGKPVSEQLQVGTLVLSTAQLRSTLNGYSECANQWVFGPDSRGRYLGMTSQGPQRLTLQAWNELLVGGLGREIEELKLIGAPEDQIKVFELCQRMLTMQLRDMHQMPWELMRDPEAS